MIKSISGVALKTKKPNNYVLIELSFLSCTQGGNRTRTP